MIAQDVAAYAGCCFQLFFALALEQDQGVADLFACLLADEELIQVLDVIGDPGALGFDFLTEVTIFGL